MHPRAAELIRELQLAAHPEGGYYRRLFTSALRDADGRAASSAILFLLPGGVVSRWHRVDADELWHYHEGAPLELLVAQTPDRVRSERLGPVAVDQLP
jgi:predicted cupin superfamily sugar epimerase